MITNDFLHYIKTFEGFRPKAYQDHVSKWTIGYGHTGDVVKGDTISEYVATKLLVHDLEKCEIYLKEYSWWSWLSDNEKLAFIDLVFNIGIGNFRKSSFNDKVLRFYKFNKEVIAVHFLRFVYSGGKELRGLVVRRQFDYNLFMYNIYSKDVLRTHTDSKQ